MKKTILTIAALLVTGFVANAQTEAGKLWLGGSIGFSTSGGSNTISGTGTNLDGTTKLSPTNTINLNPQALYFMKDNFAIGGGISYGTRSNSTKMYYDPSNGATSNSSLPGYSEFDNKNSTKGFGINLTAAQFNDWNGNWKWYYGASLGFNSGKSTSTGIDEVPAGSGTWAPVSVPGGSTTSISLGANIGATYFLSENWAFFGGFNNLFGLDFTSTKNEVSFGSGNSVSKTHNLGLNVGTGSVTTGGITFGAYYVF